MRARLGHACLERSAAVTAGAEGLLMGRRKTVSVVRWIVSVPIV